MASKSKWIKGLGAVGRILSVIPDTTEIIGRAIENTSPIIQKELDRRHARKSALLTLDDVRHLDVNLAKEHLESKGFTVITVLAKASQRWSRSRCNEVVRMVPRAGKVAPDSLIKLYYLNEELLAESKKRAQKNK
ncbi:PASTA domain-containing protein [Streptococcus dentiloxodontae]